MRPIKFPYNTAQKSQSRIAQQSQCNPGIQPQFVNARPAKYRTRTTTHPLVRQKTQKRGPTGHWASGHTIQHPCQAMTTDHSSAVHHAITGSHHKESHTSPTNQGRYTTQSQGQHICHIPNHSRAVHPPSSRPDIHPIRHSPHPHQALFIQSPPNTRHAILCNPSSYRNSSAIREHAARHI